jgi:hypothetical protein
MKTYDVQSIEIRAPFEKTFNYIADAKKLPEWTSAFKTVSNGQAVMQTPNGSVEIALAVNASREQGTIDWIMTFPDGSVAKAYSRVVEAERAMSLTFQKAKQLRAKLLKNFPTVYLCFD